MVYKTIVAIDQVARKDFMQSNDIKQIPESHIFSGNIFIFHAFDVGEDINLEKVRQSDAITLRPLTLPKYFKNYHIPLEIELPESQENSRCLGVKIHNFGAISLTYKIPFTDSLDNVRKNLDKIDDQFEAQSLHDASLVFERIKHLISKAKFYQMLASYVVIQVDPEPEKIDTVFLKENFGSIIASALRFETESLSEHQKNEILASAIGYFRGDLIVVDTEASFVYDEEWQDILDLFEFANIQQLELRYFDKVLDSHLNMIYEDKDRAIPFTSYLPFISIKNKGPVDELGKLKVDISVITERLEGSIKLAGEPYYSELYEILVDKLDLKGWQEAVNKKLSIILDIRSVLQGKINSIKEDILNVLIIILIFIELVVGLLNYASSTLH